MNGLKLLINVLVCLQLWSCSTAQISVDYDPAANLAALRTYSWASVPQQKAGDPLIDTDTLLRQRVINAVDAELARRGFRTVTQKPDFLISFFFSREQQVETSYYYPYAPFYGGYFGGPYYGYWGGVYYPGYYGPNAYPEVRDEGLLVIDFLNPKSRKLLWRGMVRDYIRFQETPAARDARINTAVISLLQQFPPH